MDIHQELVVNNNFWRLGGVISRRYYFLNSLIIISVFVMSFLIGGQFLQTPTERGSIDRLSWSVACILALLCFLLAIARFGNAFKRMRDIRASHLSEVDYILLTLSMMIPILCWMVGLYLLFTPGKRSLQGI